MKIDISDLVNMNGKVTVTSNLGYSKDFMLENNRDGLIIPDASINGSSELTLFGLSSTLKDTVDLPTPFIKTSMTTIQGIIRFLDESSSILNSCTVNIEYLGNVSLLRKLFSASSIYSNTLDICPYMYGSATAKRFATLEEAFFPETPEDFCLANLSYNRPLYGAEIQKTFLIQEGSFTDMDSVETTVYTYKATDCLPSLGVDNPYWSFN